MSDFAIDLRQNKKQETYFNEVLRSTFTREYKYFAYGGAIRGGKTYVTLAILIILCKKYHGSRWVVVRESMPALNKTTIPSIQKLLRGSSNAKWNMSGGNTHVEFLDSGSKIFFYPENIDNDKELNTFLGLECNGFFLEHVEELSEMIWDRCVERAGSWYLPDMPPPFIFTTFNPTQGWAKKKFYQPYVNGEMKKPFYFMEALPDDNPFVTKEQWEAWQTIDPLNYARMIKGDWSAFEAVNAFCFAFSEGRHVQPCEFDPNNYLHISMDFNIDPITAIASQDVDNQIRIIKEFRLSQSNIYELCERIKVEYPFASIILTGDATGRNRTALTTGNLNYYKVAKDLLQLTDQQIRVPSVNPAVRDSRVLCNSILQNQNIIFDPSCKFLIEDIKTVEVDENGDIDKKKDKHKTHLLDCWRYLLNSFHSHLLKMDLSEIET